MTDGPGRLSHICEAFDLVPWMQWGLPNSAGHYLDLVSAVLGLVLFPIGYLCGARLPHANLELLTRA